MSKEKLTDAIIALLQQADERALKIIYQFALNLMR